MNTIRDYIIQEFAQKKLNREKAREMLQELEEQYKFMPGDQDIAIIGIAGKFPKSENQIKLWENIVQGRNCIGKLSKNRIENIYSLVEDKTVLEKSGGMLDEIDMFAPSYYGLTESEAIAMDPVQRNLLEIVWKSIEDAGMSIDDIRNTRTGVYVGRDHTYNVRYNKIVNGKSLEYEAGSWSGILASRISYLLNLRGPAMVLDTACSSSMVSVYTACQELRNRKIDMAIVGGVAIDVLPVYSEVLESFVENTSAEVRTFDKHAQGTVWSEGVGAILLKPLSKAVEDKDNIYAVIKGIAINNDGLSNGILSPNFEAQEDVIVNAWKDAGINPEDISYIEAHGTGTILGDPIEIKGLTAAFRRYTSKKQFCAIGSVKTNIGHTQAVAGIASLIKVILCIKNKVIPPMINFDEVNPLIKFSESPVYINDRIRKWNSNNVLRTAGINSFGFSGTNCHLVLQEFNQEVENITEETSDVQIFTLSAMDEHTLVKYVKEFTEYTSNNSFNLSNLCFTVNAGKAHYIYRLAIVVKNKKDLLQKLDKLRYWQGGKIHEEEIYYGANSSAETNSSIYSGNEFDIKILTRETIIRYLETKRAEYIQKICEFYVCGQDIEWKMLYLDSTVRKISLPVYPAERINLWPKIDTNKNKRREWDSRENIHPLVHGCAVETLGEKVFVTEVSPEKIWTLLEHKVAGNFTMPGTAYVDMLIAIVQKYYKLNDYAMDIKFISPLMIRNMAETRNVHILTKHEKGYIEFKIVSMIRDKKKEEVWSEHAFGKLYQAPDSSDKAQYSINDLMVKLNKHIIHESMEEKLGEFEYGPRWNSLKHIYYNEEEFLLDIELSEEFKEDTQLYYLHPALMDIAANAVARIDNSLKGMYLPASYTKIRIFERMPRKFYCYVKSKTISGEEKDTISYSFSLINQNGHTFAEVEEYSVKRVRDTEYMFKVLDKKGYYNNFYRTIWKRKEIENQEQNNYNGAYLVFKDKKGMGDIICQKLKQEGCKIIEVNLSNEFKKIDDSSYSIGCNQKDYEKLLENIDIQRIAVILHFFTLDCYEIENNLSDINENLHKGVYSLFYLTKAIVESKENNKINIFIVSDYANEVTKTEIKINPCNASCVGLTKVLSSEYPNLQFNCFDIDSSTTAEEILHSLIFPNKEYQIAFREGATYIEELKECTIKDYEESNLEIKSDGIYIITGGTGGLGLEVGKYLAQKNKSNIALINRSTFPSREKWDEIIQEGQNKRLIDKVTKLIEIEQMGSNIVIISADVTDLKQMQSISQALKDKFKKINGIIQCAGKAGEGFLVRKSEDKLKKVLMPKIHGTWVLNKITENDNLDFFVMFSSLIGVFGMIGSSDYAAANSYMDAFTVNRNRITKGTISIDWPAWSETGMAYDFGLMNDDRWVFKSIKSKEAIEALDQVLNRNISRVFVGEVNHKYLKDNLNTLPFDLSEKLKTEILRSNVDYVSERANKQTCSVYEEAKDELEEKIKKIWLETLGEELGINQIGVNDDYFSIGGNSILSVKIELKMEESKINIDSSDIYRCKTIRRLAEYLREKSLRESTK